MKHADETDPDSGDLPSRDTHDAFMLKDAERYTMSEAASIKGVSYHTVSRAVRQGRLPVTRLGRMALIGGQDLGNWEPMRERAPRRYRRGPVSARSPAPALEEAFGGRIEIARHLATMFEVIHTASSELGIEEFGEVLSHRFAAMFGLTRASIWVSNLRDGTGQRLASIGPSFTSIPDNVEVTIGFAKVYAFIDLGNARVSLDPQTEFADGTGTSDTFPRGPLLIVPLRVRKRTIGALFGDCEGGSLSLDQDQLALSQVVGNQVALAVDHAILRKEQRFRINQLSAILDQMSDQVRACDTDGRLNLINQTDKIYNSGEAGPAPPLGSDALANPGVLARHELDGTLIPLDRHPLARALRGESITDWEYDVTRSDGRVQRAQVSARPIVVDDEITGAVYIGRNVTAPREEERRNGERIVRLERASQRARAIVDLTIDLSVPLQSTQQVMQLTLECLTNAVGARCGLGLIMGPDGRLSVCVGSCVPPDLPIPPLENPIFISTTIVAFSRQTAVAASWDEAGRDEQELMSSLEASGLLVIPIQIDRQPAGALHVFRDGADRFDEEDLSFATAASHLCAQAIDRLRTHQTS
ncbi:MAG: hypothetical protein WKF63_01885, partial [Thermomicrobiales bacterium]